jgi:hypothetical protein
MIDDPIVETADDPNVETPNTAPEPTEPEPNDLELWDRPTVLRFFGGIHVSTLYRNLGTLYPRPVNVAPNTVRWLGHECRTARQRLFNKRNEPQPKPQGRGRKRRRIT